MDLIWGISAAAIFLGIIGILAWDAMDQIRSRKNEWKIIKRKSNRHHRRV